jgi:hypothetical protein
LTCISYLWHLIYILSFKQIPFLVSEIFKYMLKFKNIFQVNFWPSSVTLTFSRHKGDMDSAHPLVEVNIWVKIEENPSNSVGLKRVDTTYCLIFHCLIFDLQLWPWPTADTWATWVLHIPLLRWTFESSLKKILQFV